MGSGRVKNLDASEAAGAAENVDAVHATQRDAVLARREHLGTPFWHLGTTHGSSRMDSGL